MTKRAALAVTLLWGGFLGYFAAQDRLALEVSVMLTPPLLVLTYCAFRSENIPLRIFMALSFIAHAIGAPFFFQAREYYSYSGFGAVKNFDFDTTHLFEMYVVVFVSLTLILVFTSILEGVLVLPRRKGSQAAETSKVYGGQGMQAPAAASSGMHDVALIVLVVALFVPVNWFMYVNRIGITGIVSEPMPFRLTGILYYSRMYVFPLILFWLFAKSSRNGLLVLICFLYALFSGLSSASRFVFFAPLLPIMGSLILENRRWQLGALMAAALAGFLLVSASRNSTYLDAAVGYTDMLGTAVESLLSGDSNLSFATLIGPLANRLFGAQDIVLAYQYEAAEPWLALARYFWSGGVADSVVPDLTYEFFGLVFDEGSGFGVGIGLIAYLVILGHSSLERLVVGAFVVSLLLVLANRIIREASHEILGEARSLLMTYFVALFVTLSLYSSTLKMFYWQLELLLGLTIALRLLRGVGRPGQRRPVPSELAT